MKNITSMIIDDEPLAIRLLENFVERTPELTLVASYTDSVEALSALKSNPVNLVFLDIQMPDMDGMELSRMVPADTRVIFTTAFRDYAFDSYEVNALDFLLKPIRYNKFVAAVEKARQWFSMTSDIQKPATGLDSIFIRVNGELRRISTDSIEYISGMSDYVMFYIYGEKKPLITHLTMKSVEEMLPKVNFMRVHRSYIIALDKIHSVDRNNCIYIGNEVIRVTDAYLNSFKEYLKSKLPGEKP